LVYVAVSRASQAVWLVADARRAEDQPHWHRWLRSSEGASGSALN